MRAWIVLTALMIAVLGCTLQFADSDSGDPVSQNTGVDNGVPPTVEIISPQSGQQVVLGSDVDIHVVANDAVQVTTLQLRVAGRVSSTKSFPEQTTSGEAILRWRPDRRGTFELSVVAFRDFTPSQPVTLTLQVLGRGEVIINPATGQSGASTVTGSCVARVLINNLRMRTGPGTNYTHQGTFNLNEQATVLGKNYDTSNAEWLNVQRSDSSVVWVINNRDWLEVVGQCNDLPLVN